MVGEETVALQKGKLGKKVLLGFAFEVHDTTGPDISLSSFLVHTTLGSPQCSTWTVQHRAT